MTWFFRFYSRSNSEKYEYEEHEHKYEKRGGGFNVKNLEKEMANKGIE